MNKQDIANIREAATYATHEPAHQACGETLLLACDHLEALVDQVYQGMKTTEKAEQNRDQALEKARDRECARVIETDRADGISETLQEARKHIDELEEKYTDTRLAVALLEARLFGTAYTKYDRIEAFEIRVRDLEDDITQLKAAQRPRPMDEAPKDGTPVRVIHGVQFWAGDGWIFTPNKDRSWLPLPDQDDKIS